MMYLDFGDAEVEDDNLPGRASGKRTDSDEERRKITEDATERYQYLRKSGKTLPLLKFFNDDYVYIFLAKAVRGYGSHYIYNRKKNEGFSVERRKALLYVSLFWYNR